MQTKNNENNIIRVGRNNWVGPVYTHFSGDVFVFFRPQMKKQKEEKLFRDEVKKGTRIVTTSGIHAKILEVGDTYLVIESENSRFKIEKSAVSKDLSAQYSK